MKIKRPGGQKPPTSLLEDVSIPLLLAVCVCVCVRLVTQSCLILVTPWTVAGQSPLFMGIFQTRMLEWVAMPSSRGSSQPRDEGQVSRIVSEFFTARTTRKAQEYGIV